MNPTINPRSPIKAIPLLRRDIIGIAYKAKHFFVSKFDSSILRLTKRPEPSQVLSTDVIHRPELLRPCAAAPSNALQITTEPLTVLTMPLESERLATPNAPFEHSAPTATNSPENSTGSIFSRPYTANTGSSALTSPYNTPPKPSTTTHLPIKPSVVESKSTDEHLESTYNRIAAIRKRYQHLNPASSQPIHLDISGPTDYDKYQDLLTQFWKERPRHTSVTRQQAWRLRGIRLLFGLVLECHPSAPAYHIYSGLTARAHLECNWDLWNEIFAAIEHRHLVEQIIARILWQVVAYDVDIDKMLLKMGDPRQGLAEEEDDALRGKLRALLSPQLL